MMKLPECAAVSIGAIGSIWIVAIARPGIDATPVALAAFSQAAGCAHALLTYPSVGENKIGDSASQPGLAAELILFFDTMAEASTCHARLRGQAG